MILRLVKVKGGKGSREGELRTSEWSGEWKCAATTTSLAAHGSVHMMIMMMDHIELWIEIGAQFLLPPVSHTLLYLLFLSLSLSLLFLCIICFFARRQKWGKVHWKASPFLWQGSAEQSEVRLSSLCIDLILDFDVVFPASAQKEKLKWNEMRMSWAKEKMNWELKNWKKLKGGKRRRGRDEQRAEQRTKGAVTQKDPRQVEWAKLNYERRVSERSLYRSLQSAKEIESLVPAPTRAEPNWAELSWATPRPVCESRQENERHRWREREGKREDHLCPQATGLRDRTRAQAQAQNPEGQVGDQREATTKRDCATATSTQAAAVEAAVAAAPAPTTI